MNSAFQTLCGHFSHLLVHHLNVSLFLQDLVLVLGQVLSSPMEALTGGAGRRSHGSHPLPHRRSQTHRCTYSPCLCSRQHCCFSEGCLCWRWSVLSLLLMHILTLHALHGTRTCTLSIQKQCSQLKMAASSKVHQSKR